jgi:diguanylate cyclase (GGDEF)-like protein
LVAVAGLLAVAIFFIDIMMPFGDAGGVPYVALVCLGWWHPRRQIIYLFAAVASVLIVAAFTLFDSEPINILTFSNRVLALIAIWVTAALLVMARRAESALLESNDKLENLVRDRTRELEQEIAERRQAEAIITHMANHDSLTGLPIRPLFMDRLSHALAAARRSGHDVAVLFVDLDGFKSVNDSFGHEAGDRLLKEAARRLLASVRETDTVARHGGDEFTVVLTDVADRNAVTTIARKMIETLAQPFKLQDDEARIGASIGIALYSANGHKPEELLERADAAMYVAKEDGKNTYAYATPDGTGTDGKRSATA